MDLITLTTDFGAQDWYVGTMKGVILGIAPKTRLVDITHDIPPGNVTAAAFALASAYSYFPKGTVHLVVVDPGVGTARSAVAVATPDFFFVGPDNGVLYLAVKKFPKAKIHRLSNRRWHLPNTSSTFHGRDVFAPVAARLSVGQDLASFGPYQEELIALPWPKLRRSNTRIEGQIVYLDRFGNAITNIPENDAITRSKNQLVVSCGRNVRNVPIQSTYQDVPVGKTVALIGSSSFLEIAVNQGDAAKVHCLHIGDQVSVEPRPPRTNRSKK